MSTVTTCTCGHEISQHTYSDTDCGCDIEGCNCMLDLGELIDKYAKEVADRTEQNLQDMKEIAQLKADRENAYALLRTYNTPMPCGHLGAYAVGGEEGTQYCVMCLADDLGMEINRLDENNAGAEL